MQNQNQSAENYQVKTSIIKKLIPVLLLLAIWQAAAMLLNQKILLASPAQVAVRLFTLWKEPDFVRSILFSFLHIAGGFCIALIAGVVLAVLAGKIQWVELLLSPIMLTVKTVPVASFIIIALVWLSSSRLSIFISFLMVLPVIYNNVLAGIQSIDVKMLEMAEIYHIGFAKRFRYIWLPTIRPYLMSGTSTALGLAWKAGIAAEVIGIPDGSIGEMLYNAKVYLNTADLFAWTVIIVILSVCFEKIVMWLMKKAYDRYCN